jgi:1-acyl-sn-glycerol-3-phosphate acyltransferase
MTGAGGGGRPGRQGGAPESGRASDLVGRSADRRALQKAERRASQQADPQAKRRADRQAARPAGEERLFGFLRLLLAAFLAVFYRVSAEGRENVPEAGAAIICANHVCFKDLVLIGACVRRKVRWIAKAELFRNPVIGALLAGLGAFPVERGASDRGAVETVYRVLEGGGLLGIFPEGWRVRDPSRRPRAKRGFVSFALNARAPLIPVSIKYSGSPFGRARLFSRIHVVFGEQVVLDYGKKYERAELRAIGDGIMDGIYSRIL